MVANMGQSIIVIDTLTDRVVKMLPCGAGCHGANFGAKKAGVLLPMSPASSPMN